MKKILLIIACIGVLTTQAQIKQVTLQASGLTCSMCSRAIYSALQKMSLADSISSDIETSSYTLYFNNEKPVSFDAIRDAVEGAGFSVVKMEVTARVNNLAIRNDAHVQLGDATLHFLKVKEQVLDGEQRFMIVDKHFVADKTYRQYAATTTMQCVKTGVMQSCCTKTKVASKRIYHVTV